MSYGKGRVNWLFYLAERLVDMSINGFKLARYLFFTIAAVLAFPQFALAGNWVDSPWPGASCMGTMPIKPKLYMQTCIYADTTFHTIAVLVYVRSTGTVGRKGNIPHWIGVPSANLFVKQSDGRGWPLESIKSVRVPGGCGSMEIKPGEFKNCVAIYIQEPDYGIHDLGWLARNLMGNARIAVDGEYIGYFGTPVLFPR
jgi:hypothetical protein